MELYYRNKPEGICGSPLIPRKNMKKLFSTLQFVFSRLLIFLFILMYSPADGQKKNDPVEWKPYAELRTGMSWPRGQALPQFAGLSDTLDGFDLAKSNLSSPEKTIFVALQGLVNKTKPRIFLYDAPGEGKNKWPENLHLKINEYPSNQKWALVKKYRNEIAGVILYSTEKNAAYLNLATTIGGIKNALPVTPPDYEELEKNGIHLPVLADLTTLPYNTPAGIYQYLYDHYWKDCTKRVLVSLSTGVPAKIRDIGIASKAAFVWLDPRKEEEKKVLEEFLGDMKAGQGIIIGWWPEERSGVGLGTSHGIPTVAADFYENASVYAGMPHVIDLPETPKMPKQIGRAHV